MAQLILHKDGAYNLYSTIADGACYESALTLEQLEEAIRFEQGEQGVLGLPVRLERAHKTGCSSLDGETLEECITCNRAGPNETKLSLDEFVAKYLTLTPNAEISPLRRLPRKMRRWITVGCIDGLGGWLKHRKDEAMTEADELQILRDECRGFRSAWAKADSRLMDAEKLLAEAADFIGNLRVGVTPKRRDFMVNKITAFLPPNA